MAPLSTELPVSPKWVNVGLRKYSLIAKGVFLIASILLTSVGCSEKVEWEQLITDPLQDLRTNPAGDWRITLTEEDVSVEFSVIDETTSFESQDFHTISPSVSIVGAKLLGMRYQNEDRERVCMLVEDRNRTSSSCVIVLSKEGNTLILGGDSEEREISRLERLP